MATSSKVTVKGSNYKKIVITQAEKDSLMNISIAADKKGENASLAAFLYLSGISRLSKTLSSLGNPPQPSVIVSPISAGKGKYTVYVGSKDLELIVGKTTKPAKQKTKAPVTASSTPSSAPDAGAPAKKQPAKRKTTPAKGKTPAKKENTSTEPDTENGEEPVEDSTNKTSGHGFYYAVSRTGRPVRRRYKTESKYERADIASSKGLDQLTAERIAGGESFGKALSGGVSERTQAAMMNLKKKFDPINLAHQVPIFGKTLAAAVGKKRPEDVSYLTGIEPRTSGIPKMDEMDETPEPSTTKTKRTATKVTSGKASNKDIVPVLNVIAKNTMPLIGISRDINVLRQNIISIGKHLGADVKTKADAHYLKEKELKEKTKVQVGEKLTATRVKRGKSSDSEESPVSLLTEIRDLLSKRMEKDDIADNFGEEREKENQRRHEELIAAILGNGKPAKKGKKTAAKESGGGLMDKAKGFFGGAGDALKGLGSMAKGILALAASLWIISKALENFSNITWGSVLKGVAVMAALAATTKLIKEVDAAKSILALGASLWIVSKALQNFEDIGWESIIKGVASLAALAATTKLLEGGVSTAASLILLAGGVWAISKALQSFADLSWGDIAKGVITIGALAAGAAALSGFAPMIAMSAGALALLGGSLWILGKGLAAIAENFDSLIDGLEKLGELDGTKLLKVAAGIGAISVALLAFGAAQMATALTNLVSNFLSLGQDSPVEQLEKIGKAGPGIEKAADGMERLADAMAKFANIDAGDFSKLMATLNDFPWMKATVLSAVGGVFQVTTKNGTVSGGAGKYLAQPAQPTQTTTRAKPLPGKTATKVTTTTESISGTLKGVTSDQIQSHPNFKKYYQQAISEGSDKQSAYEEAAMMVKSDMLKPKTQTKATPVSQPQPLSTRMNESVKENLNLVNEQKQPSTPVVVNAPKSTTVVNNKGGSGGSVSGIRNDDSVLTRLQYQNYRPV